MIFKPEFDRLIACPQCKYYVVEHFKINPFYFFKVICCLSFIIFIYLNILKEENSHIELINRRKKT